MEIFVVDNNSVDGSSLMVKEKFPEIILVENKKNTGFSFANNQAIRLSKGEYVLLLNPDTLVEEDTFEKIINFMDIKPEAGGLGVKMIDGKGNFLPESKRGLPTPMVAFYKIFGLSKLFPKSKIFGKYHLTYLDKEQIHEIEILSGAFMLLRRIALDKVGLLDETFFMYGEDIDLSYRIIQGGFRNYYFSDTTIIHYKGESTKKGSINYVLVFYNAMIIFAKKHFTKERANLFSVLIRFAIYFRAGLSILKRLFLTLFLPVTDATMIFCGYLIIAPFWERIRFPDGGTYPDLFYYLIVPAYIGIWLSSIFFSGGYRKPIRLEHIAKGIGIGTVLILITYSLLNEEHRFSRALILIGALWALITTISWRLILHLLKNSGFHLTTDSRKRLAIAGGTEEVHRVLSLLQFSEINPEIVGRISPEGDEVEMLNHSFIERLGELSQIRDITLINKLDEIIFCSKDISSQLIIKNMLELSDTEVQYKIAPPESLSIIGSNSIHAPGELYIVNINSIAKESNRRNKRILDLLFSGFFLLLFPVLFIIVKNNKGFFKNIFHVFTGKKSWVGYYFDEEVKSGNLPPLRQGILTPLDSYRNCRFNTELMERLNTIYAKNYQVNNDLWIIFKGLRNLGK
jgi:GT2 family glycosyltransferase